MSTLRTFIQSERANYAGNDNNVFALAGFQAARYYDFVLLIAERHARESKDFSSMLDQFIQSVTGSKRGRLSPEQERLMAVQEHLTTVVHLEIESFYLFAKMLLDTIARFIETYFGLGRGHSLVSHDKLTKNFVAFAELKSVRYSKTFIDSLMYLKEHICDHRDKQITHQRSMRTVRGTVWGASGGGLITASPIFPQPSEQWMQSKDIPELLTVLDRYVLQVIAVISSNRTRSRFKHVDGSMSLRPEG